MNTFDEIIQTKAFSDLTPQELEIISELVSSEEEYNEMKVFFTEINQLAVSSRDEVSGSVKSSLNSIFQAKHPGISQNWSAPNEAVQEKVIPVYNQNWFRVAALLVLSAGITTFWFSLSEDQITDKANQAVTASEQSPEKVGQTDSSKSQKEKEPFPIEASTKDFTASSDIATAEDKNPEEKEGEHTPPVLASAPGTYSVTAFDKKTSTSNEGAANIYGNTQFAKSSVQDDKEDSFSKAGMDADLNPLKDKEYYALRENQATPQISTDDLLSLIEPSF